jgi:exosortase
MNFPAFELREPRILAKPMRHWPAIAGLLCLAIPTLISLAQQNWTRESGAHAPLVLVTGAWLISVRLKEIHEAPKPGSLATTLLFLLPAMLFYVFGRAFDYLFFEALGLYVGCIAVAYAYVGWPFLRKIGFPILFLAFAIPLPEWVLDQSTAPLKEFASYVTTGLLQKAGIPIVREGVTLYVAQYQLLVEDACAGLNAIVGLTSLGLLYAYLLRSASWQYCVLLLLFILPIAVLANIIRIIVLVLLTLYGGNDLAQGFLHGVAGLFLFGTALALVFALDSVLWPLLGKRLTARA